jgi:tetratricopeptide (TPR) repeat protein
VKKHLAHRTPRFLFLMLTVVMLLAQFIPYLRANLDALELKQVAFVTGDSVKNHLARRLSSPLSSGWPRKASALFWEAQLDIWQGHSFAAETALQQMIDARQRVALGRFMLGNLYLSLGERDQAIATYRMAPDIAHYYLYRGQRLLEIGKAAEAADMFRLSIAIGPTVAEPYRWLGSALWSEPDRVNEMVTAFRKYLELEHEPQLGRFVVSGQLSIAEGRWADAENAWRQVISLDPGYSLAYFFLGWALAEQGRCAEAIIPLQKAQALNPDKWSLLYLARCQRELGELREAEATYIRLLEREPGWNVPQGELEALRRKEINHD